MYGFIALLRLFTTTAKMCPVLLGFPIERNSTECHTHCSY